MNKTEQAYIDMQLNEGKVNPSFNKIAKGIVDLRGYIDDLAKADEGMDLHDQIISMEKSLDAVWKTATKASKIAKGARLK